MSVDVAIPCGLILNELLTNSLKHGFPDGRRGEITVSLTARDGQVVLTVADTGIGIPDDVNLGRTASLGMRLIRSFIRQLQGEFHIRRLVQGTEATASFPHPSTPAGPLEPR
jgi:two-component sensor histidine kinase